jgi:hypothetical protein
MTPDRRIIKKNHLIFYGKCGAKLKKKVVKVIIRI